ncbi:Transcription regulator lscL, partial [Fulvia fulva]
HARTYEATDSQITPQWRRSSADIHRDSTVVVVDHLRSPASLGAGSNVSSGGGTCSGGLSLTEKQPVRAERRPGHQRRYAPKTRAGCLTIRRVRCDEEKPYCRRCTTTGRKCDGYASPFEGNTSSPEPLAAALVNDVSCNALERRTFDYFRARTAPCVSGYFHDSVWDRIVLQLSYSEPAARHAVNALGALHEERNLRKTATLEGVNVTVLKNGFPLSQYSKALKGMQGLLKTPSVCLDTVLLCSLLCIHFEALREAFVPALMHVENAIQLLHSSTTFDARKVHPSLVRAIMRIDLQGTMYLGSRVPGLPFYTAATDSILPNSFHDLTHARDLVNTWTSRIYHFMRTVADEFKFRDPGNVPLEQIAKAQEMEQTFLQLDRLLWSFMHKPTVKLTVREQHGLGMLRSRVKINRILSATCLYCEATMFDNYFEDFDEILTICMYILASDNAERRLFSVSLDEGLIHPLFFIATHCRDGRIRHQALEQLRKLPVRDGVRHAETTTRTAEICVRFEEALCGKEVALRSDIPEWRRVHSAGFNGWDNDSDRRQVKVHLKTRPNGPDGGWLDSEAYIEWPVDSVRFKILFGLLMNTQLLGVCPTAKGIARYLRGR